MRIAVLTTMLMAFATQAGGQRKDLFAPAADSPVTVGRGSGTLILADLDRDGHPDMLTRHLLTRRVMVLLGNGRGGFSPAGSIGFEYEPGDMATGDFDKDGTLDLAVTPGNRDVVDVWLGTGKGTFSKTAASPITVSTGIEPFNKRTLRLADIDEDGNLDIVTANGRRQTTIGVVLGDGRGAFTPGPRVMLDADRDGYVFALADLDGDTHLDIVTGSRSGYEDAAPGRVTFQYGNGKGTFTAARQPPMHVQTGPRAVAVADVNGDGRSDVMIGHQGGELSVLLNEGGGRFAHAAGSPFALDLQAWALRPADVNGDRHIDLIAATVGSVTILLGDGRRFTPAPGSPYRAGPGAYDLGVGDVNGDGKLDVAASSFEGDAVTMLLGR